VLKSSAHQADAQRFVAFLVSSEGQSIIANSGSFEYPLNPSAPTPAGEPPLSSLHPAALSVTDLGTGASALALLQEAQLL
jgi:iron(III) transport system substrate-binding protein